LSDLVYNYIPASEDNRNTDMWTVVGDRGAVHIWVVENPDSSWGETHYGGIEVHSKKPMYGCDRPPSHTDCWLLGGDCWHDGSSLYFSERICPMLRFGKDEITNEWHSAVHSYMESVLHSWYNSNFNEDREYD